MKDDLFVICELTKQEAREGTNVSIPLLVCFTTSELLRGRNMNAANLIAGPMASFLSDSLSLKHEIFL